VRRMEPREKAACARVATEAKDFLNYIDEWYNSELTNLPLAKDDLMQKQGRCQVLKELKDKFDQSVSGK